MPDNAKLICRVGSRAFLNIYYHKNRFPDDFTDEEYQDYVTAICALIHAGALEYVPPADYYTRDVGDREHWDSYPMAEIYSSLLFFKEDLNKVVTHGEKLPCDDAMVVPYAIGQECHAVSAFHWALNKDRLNLFAGITDGCHSHSWTVCKLTGKIEEPTPIIRDSYFGAPVEDPETFLQTEMKNVLRLADAEKIPKEEFKKFAELVA
jgi:hypothetical protein